MRVKVFDIPPSGLEVVATTGKHPWFRQVVSSALPTVAADGSVELWIQKGEENVTVSGSCALDLIPRCDRCLESFTAPLAIPLHQLFLPAGSSLEEEEEGDGCTDDLDCSFYHDQTIEVGEFVREQILLAVPVQFHCREGCRGLCPRCGVNLNRETCVHYSRGCG